MGYKGLKLSSLYRLVYLFTYLLT